MCNKYEAQNPPSKKHIKKKNTQVRLTSWVDEKTAHKKSHEAKHKKYARQSHSFWYNMCFYFKNSKCWNAVSFLRSNISGDDIRNIRNH